MKVKFKRVKEKVDKIDEVLEVRDPDTDEVITEAVAPREAQEAVFVEVRTIPVEEVEEGVSEQDIQNEIVGLQSRLKNRKALLKSLKSFKTKNIAEGEEPLTII